MEGPARTGSVRAHNLALVLRAVAAGGPVSRAEVAAATGLTRASVSALVETLLAGRLLRETGAPTRTGVGRPSTGLELDPRGPAGLGIELNVDHVAVCLVDLTGGVRVRLAGRFPALDTLLGDAVAAGSALGLSPAGAAFAVPGLVDPATGELLVTPNLDAGGVREAVLGSAALRGVPISVENEATLAARAEQRALGDAAPRSFLQVSGEVGIGAGLVLDGRLYRGSHGWSGELGHVTVRPGGRPCGCGSDGCLEQYAGLRAILRAAGGSDGDRSGRSGRSGRSPEAGGGGSPEAGAGRSPEAGIAARARAGEPGMLGALAEAGEALGIALAGALNLLDLDAVVLGGAHAELAPWLVGPIEEQLARRLVGAAVSRPVVRASVLGADAAALGAAWSVLDRVLDDPGAWLGR
ncbi:Sugar kinase of the NBD/HSP70 family, may contain an N-terminal HTH domain [Cryptosporangium aurantiacum]|uniref:Sugar kinase of the NBD/HSP70 family, may contain an N-terminal HTH domain n=1 Tax=Cryptosporangium aurantiacum TaxID=134849 RepID=A0A1M7RIG3_9ACTN|nr:Sugar kinase of the NBD/HSP70 family, may contain an N-terminal HTH domain [Cryptosporangium aurantiacum]